MRQFRGPRLNFSVMVKNVQIKRARRIGCASFPAKGTLNIVKYT